MQQPSSTSYEPNFVTEEVPIQSLPEIQYLKSLEPSAFRELVKIPESLVFDIPLSKYPLQPWARSQKLLKNAKNQEQFEMSKNHLNQWFNYDLTPEQFEVYAKRQLEVKNLLKDVEKTLPSQAKTL